MYIVEVVINNEKDRMNSFLCRHLQCPLYMHNNTCTYLKAPCHSVCACKCVGAKLVPGTDDVWHITHASLNSVEVKE